MTLSHLFSFVPQPSIILRWVFHLSNLFFFVGLNVVNTFLDVLSKISLAVVIILLIADDTDHPTVRLGTDIQIPVQSLRRRWTKQTWVYRYIGDTLG